MDPPSADDAAWRQASAVGWSAHEKWRRRLGWMAGVSLPLLSVLSGIPHKREPRGGEFFHPGDLTAGWWTFLLWALMGLFVVSLIAWRQRLSRAGPPARHSATITVEDDELVVVVDGEERRIPLTDIEHVFYDGAEKASVVRLRGGELATIAGHGGDHHRLLVALGIDPAAKTARFPVGSLASALPGGLPILRSLFAMTFVVLLVTLTSLSTALLGGELAAAGTWISWLLGSSGALAMLGWLLRRRSLVVGIDGVRIDGVLRQRFIPLDEIERITEEEERDCFLERKDGTSVYLREVPDGGGLNETVARAVTRRDAARLAAAEPLDDLQRGDRDAEQWRDDIAKLTQSSYRAKRLRIADLEALLEDPTADPEQRIAAAVALSPDGDAHKRIRVAAQACADADMRAALEAAAEGEVALGQLERALKRVEG